MLHAIAGAMLLLLASDVAVGQQRDSMPARAGFVKARHDVTPQREAARWRPDFDFLDANALSSDAAWLARNPTGLGGRTVLTSDDLQTTYLLVRRSIASEPEVHARWDDIVIVRSGTGVIVMGDSLVGSTYRAPGERVGGNMNRNYQLVVRAGDIVRIPAAVPHMFIVSGAEPLEYLVIKQRRQALPIRWDSGR